MEKIITVEEKDAALKECLDWLENAPFDYHNGNSACGVDEGNVWGWEGHSAIVKKIKNALGIQNQTHPLPPDPFPFGDSDIPF